MSFGNTILDAENYSLRRYRANRNTIRALPAAPAGTWALLQESRLKSLAA